MSQPPCRELKCTACCRWGKGNTYLHPELAVKEVTRYQHVFFKKIPVMADDGKGNCVYLDKEKGCTIHNNSPAYCRSFDCLQLLVLIKRYPETEKEIPKHILDAARRRAKYT